MSVVELAPVAQADVGGNQVQREVDEQEMFEFEDVPEFWSSLARASAGTTVVIMVFKVLLTVAYGFWSGFEIEMNRVFGFIPQFVFGLGQDRFEHMVRASWAFSSIGAILWWGLRALGVRSDRRDTERLSGAYTETDRGREELRYAVFVANAQRRGEWIGMWIGSLTLLGILTFEYLRKWLIDDIDMPPFPVLVFVVALVPVVALVWEWSRRSSHPRLPATEIAGILDGTPESVEP